MSALLPHIAKPSPDEVRKYLARWRDGDNEKIHAALSIAFEAMPKNSDVGEVGLKVAALNGLYSTNIFGLVQVAQHIVSLDIDDALAEHTADPMLIEKIANVEIGGKKRRNYSFATKYCNFHRPDVYPIYDSLVVGVLKAFLEQGETFDTLKWGERWETDYAIWHRSISRFRMHYRLEEFSMRDIDKYLWMVAKERQAMRGASSRSSEDPPTQA